MPSKFLGHRRALQFCRHISHDAWFATLLPMFHGQGPLKRLTGIASLYGLNGTTDVDAETGASYPFSREQWQRIVRDVVDDAAVKHLQVEAAQRQLPGPEVVLKKKKNLLKLVPRPYVREGGELATYGVVFRQCALSSRFASWDLRRERACQHCFSQDKFGDPCHMLTCAGASAAFLEARESVLTRLTLPTDAPDIVARMADMTWANEDKVWLKAGLNLMKKAFKLAQGQPHT
jgi:hypothetical protein